MPPRLVFSTVCRSLAIRTRPSIQPPRVIQVAARRGFAARDGKSSSDPSQNAFGSVSEEAAHISKVTGDAGPELSQGTPVQDILNRDEESRQKSPQVIKNERSGKAEAEAAEELESRPDAESEVESVENLLALGQLENVATGGLASDALELGHKFDLPTLPIPSDANMKHRYAPIVTQITNLLMKDGKKSKAQRNMAFILNYLRTAPQPVYNPARPLLPGTPPASHLPLNPVLYLATALDSVAPLLRIRSQKGAAGGGASLQIPVPLRLKQRRRQAFMWVLAAVEKKSSRGSGRGQFAQRVAEELISIVEGKSSIWDKRTLVHKTGTAARVNLNYRPRKRM